MIGQIKRLFNSKPNPLNEDISYRIRTRLLYKFLPPIENQVN